MESEHHHSALACECSGPSTWPGLCPESQGEKPLCCSVAVKTAHPSWEQLPALISSEQSSPERFNVNSAALFLFCVSFSEVLQIQQGTLAMKSWRWFLYHCSFSSSTQAGLGPCPSNLFLNEVEMHNQNLITDFINMICSQIYTCSVAVKSGESTVGKIE